jgi:ATP-dependent protease ClpP protease subunit
MTHSESKPNTKYLYLNLIGNIDFETVRPLVETLDAIRNDDNVSQIALTLNSTGGGFYSAFGLFDYLKAYPKPVDIIAMGACQSSAAAVLQTGRRRLAHPHTFFWLHEGKYSIQDHKTVRLIQADIADFEMQEEVFVEILSSKASISKKQLKALCRSEHGFGAQEAIKLGLIDQLFGSR